MADENENGGTAFPTHAAHGNAPGMSLRDWFAGMALQGMIARADYALFPDDDSLNDDHAANNAYNIADAMLAMRAKARGTTGGS